MARVGRGILACSLASALLCAHGAACGAQPVAAPVRHDAPAATTAWRPYLEWSEGCPLEVASGGGDGPVAPIAWETCPGAPADIGCRSMRLEWTDAQSAIGLTPLFARDAEGRALLMVRRLEREAVTDVIAEADGRVLFAVRQSLLAQQSVDMADPGCFTLPAALTSERYLLGVRGHDRHGRESLSTHEGVLGGGWTMAFPRVLERYDDEQAYSFLASTRWIVRVAAPALQVHARPWSPGAAAVLVTSAERLGADRKPTQLVLYDDTLFWTSASRSQHAIHVWDAGRGARPLIDFGDDASRGAADLGTDGTHLVWTQARGKAPAAALYPERSIMTARFTGDGSALSPRRLRSQPYPALGVHSFVVGCGYAAHAADANTTLLVRLADGVSWRLPSRWPDFLPQRPLGLTCRDLFVLGRYGARANIARFDLDALGPGLPPD
jgi:hypothetical protein